MSAVNFNFNLALNYYSNYNLKLVNCVMCHAGTQILLGLKNLP